MKVWYDFHIHSALSPCGDDDMTPYNIAAMAALKGLGAIALTDHNAAGNCKSLCEAGREFGLTVLSGMELETSEEVHVVMLFPSPEAAEECGRYVSARRLRVRNRPEVFGRQMYLGAHDEVLGEEEDLLITATDIGVYEVAALAKKYGGTAFPAHIDRPAHGLVQMLGDIDPAMGFRAVEISPMAPAGYAEEWKRRGYKILRNSDAHYLESINEKDVNFFETDETDPEALIALLDKR